MKPPTNDWVLETFLVDPRGKKIASEAFISDSRPEARARQVPLLPLQHPGRTVHDQGQAVLVQRLHRAQGLARPRRTSASPGPDGGRSTA